MVIIKAKKIKQRSLIERIEAKLTCWAADLVQEVSIWRQTKHVPTFVWKEGAIALMIGLSISAILLKSII